MSQEIGSIHYDLDLDDSKFKSKLDSASKSFKETGKSVSDFGGRMTATVTAPILGIAGIAIKAAADVEQFQIALTTMLGSEEKAIDLMKELTDFAAKTPFELTDIQKSTRSLLAYGVAGEDVTNVLKTIGDVASGVNAPINELADIFGKMKSGVVAQTEDLNQLAGRGIPIFDFLAEKYQTTVSGVREMASKSQISFGDIEEAFRSMSGEGGQFFNLMEKQSTSTAGKFSTLKDSLTQIGVSIGQMLLPVANQLIDSLSGFLAVIQTLNPSTQRLIAIIAFVAAAIGPLLLILGSLISTVGTLLPIIAAVGAVLASPITIIALLVAGFIALGIKLGWFSDLVQKLSVFVQPLIDQFWIMVHQVQEQLFQAFEQLKPSFEQLTEAFKKSEPLFKLIGVIIGVTLYTAFQVLMLAINVLASVVSAVVPRIVEMFTAAVNIIVGLIEFVVALFQGDWKKAWESLITIGESVRIFISGFVLIVLDLIKGLVTGIVNYFMGLYNSLVGHSIIPDIVNGIIGWFGQIGSGVANALKGVYEAIVEPFMRAYKKVSEIASKVKSSLEKISPFHKSSPSLVEYVEMGASKITAMYDDMFSKINVSSGETRSGMIDTFGQVATGTGGGITVNLNPSGIVARSRQEWRSIMADGIESINEELRARGIDEIGGGYVQGLSTIK